jgi:hypothetical protein
MLVGFCIDYGSYAQIIMFPSTVNGMRKMMNYSGCTLPEGAFEERECLEEREGALEREAGAMAFKQVWLNASRLSLTPRQQLLYLSLQHLSTIEWVKRVEPTDGSINGFSV